MRNGAPRRKGPTERPALKIDRGGGKGGHLMARLGGRFATVPTSSGELPRERCGRFCVSSGPGSAAGPARSGQQPGRSIFVRHSLDVQDHLQFVRAPNAPTTRRSPGDLCTAQLGEKRGSRLIRDVSEGERVGIVVSCCRRRGMRPHRRFPRRCRCRRSDHRRRHRRAAR
jgi:hypothetical protein